MKVYIERDEDTLTLFVKGGDRFDKHNAIRLNDKLFPEIKNGDIKEIELGYNMTKLGIGIEHDIECAEISARAVELSMKSIRRMLRCGIRRELAVFGNKTRNNDASVTLLYNTKSKQSHILLKVYRFETNIHVGYIPMCRQINISHKRKEVVEGKIGDVTCKSCLKRYDTNEEEGFENVNLLMWDKDIPGKWKIRYIEKAYLSPP